MGRTIGVVSSVDAASMKSVFGQLDMVLVTVNVMLNWKDLMRTLRPHGRLHVVGVVPQAMGIEAGVLIGGQRSVSARPRAPGKTLTPCWNSRLDTGLSRKLNISR